jgi:hypothetical protein
VERTGFVTARNGNFLKSASAVMVSETPCSRIVTAVCRSRIPETAMTGVGFSGTFLSMANFTVTCPCCNARLTLDSSLEAVIAHEAPPRPRSGLGLDGALSSLKGAAARREELFKQQIKAEQKKPQVLDRKFQEGLKKAKDSPDPPINPMNLD